MLRKRCEGMPSIGIVYISPDIVHHSIVQQTFLIAIDIDDISCDPFRRDTDLFKLLVIGFDRLPNSLYYGRTI